MKFNQVFTRDVIREIAKNTGTTMKATEKALRTAFPEMSEKMEADAKTKEGQANILNTLKTSTKVIPARDGEPAKSIFNTGFTNHKW